MTKKAKQYPNPRFSTLAEEDEYWKTHSPLDEGYKGEVQKSKQKRSSFLSIRLTGEEITKLRNVAAKFGMGPSTYVRQLLKLTIEPEYLTMYYLPFLPPALLESSGSPDEFLARAEKAYANYLKAQKELLKAYQKNKQKA